MMPARHALIIGIDHYPHMAEKYQLRGCVNDAKLIRNILINKFDFNPESIVALYDEAATRDAIVAQMERLAEELKTDDILVFHFSGHGSRSTTKAEHTEGSGADNCILPHDDSEMTPEGKKIYREVRDDQFKEWLQRIATRTPYTTLIFDCCHSGTMTRGRHDSTRVRTVPLEVRRQGAEAERAVPASTARRPVANKPGGDWLTNSDHYVVISGCRDMQKSKERTFIKNGQEVRHGLLTYHLSNAIFQAKPGTTYRDVFELACAGVVSSVAAQNPQLEGAIDRELFGIRDIEPLRYIPVIEANGDTLTLDGGAAHGLRRGSKWAVYPPGTKLADGAEKIGVVEISQVGALSSTAVVKEGMGQVTVGARCVEIEAGSATDPLTVDLSELDPQNRASIEPAIRQSRLLVVADAPDAADIHARIITSTRSFNDNFPASKKAQITGPTWVFYEDEGTLSMPLHSVTEPGVSRVLLRNLEKIAKFRNVLLLNNQDSTLNVEFNLYQRTPDDQLVLANGGNTEFGERDAMVLEVKNNEESRPVFFSIIWISANREISHFYPHRKSSEELVAGKQVRIGHRERKLTASLADDYLSDIGSETCKVFFSTRESDLSWLNQEGTRSGNSANSGLAAVDAALNGDTAAEGEEDLDSGDPPAEEWVAINRSFVLKRT